MPAILIAWSVVKVVLGQNRIKSLVKVYVLCMTQVIVSRRIGFLAECKVSKAIFWPTARVQERTFDSSGFLEDLVSTITHQDTVQVSPLTNWVIGGDMIGNSTQTVFQCFLQAIVSSSSMGRDVHSLRLPIQHFFCRPRRRPPSKMPWRMVFGEAVVRNQACDVLINHKTPPDSEIKVCLFP